MAIFLAILGAFVAGGLLGVFLTSLLKTGHDEPIRDVCDSCPHMQRYETDQASGVGLPRN